LVNFDYRHLSLNSIIEIPRWYWYFTPVFTALSLCGLIFLINEFRYLLVIATANSLFLIYWQGKIQLDSSYNLLIQIGAGLVGASIALAFFGGLKWKSLVVNITKA
jgi:hypothetical protein